MRTYGLSNLAALAICAALVGCATTRSEVKVGAPAAAPAATAAVTKSRAILIRAVTDERVFEQAPSDPSVPSLGFEGAAKATAETKARAIARKRGAFGGAFGDILLENGQTVTGVVQESLTAALRDAGYKVTTNPADAGQSPLVMNVRVKRFWAWFKPGFWAITLSADILTNLEVEGLATPLAVTVHTEDSRQIATDGAWIELVDRALKEYRTQAVAKAAALP
jgi:hypothetical protein